MINKIYEIFMFEKYNIYIWSSFLITFLLLFIQLGISIIMHNRVKEYLKKMYKNEKNK